LVLANGEPAVHFRHANVMILLAAIGSFLPVVAVHSVLDDYIRIRETAALQRGLDAVAMQIARNAHAGIAALRRILAESPSLCGPTFITLAQREIEHGLTLKDVLVENADAVQYCDALGRPVLVSPLSQQFSLPGQTETLTLVRLGSLSMPVVRLTQAFGKREVSAFVPLLSIPLEGELETLHPGTSLRLSMADGSEIMAGGPVVAADDWGPGSDRIAVRSLAGDIPVRIEARVPFALVRADYADFSVAFTVIAGLVSAALLLLMLQLARRANLPGFDLERAIRNNEIKPYYQPVIDVVTGRLAGCEVLARWIKSTGEVSQPGPFIDYAEMTGLAVPMTLSMMKQVNTDLASLCDEMPNLKISINLFDGHFRDTAIVDDVQAIFSGSRIGFNQLVFEITERRPLPDSPAAAAVIGGLHALGARLAMDDVGTGHSNLAYMQTLGVDVIKIDRIFIQMIRPDLPQVPVLDGLIGMAQDLGTDIVAEGIETPEQATYLRSRGVRLAQGYLFAPALKPAAFVALARALNGGVKPASSAPARKVIAA
jgi:EAL domain-containing protein (putative c-di-GMP-specific phosphodiesterase class I)